MDKPMGPILGKGQSEAETPSEPHDQMEADLSEEEVSAASDVRLAMQSGDDEDFAMALKNFISKCGGY